MENTPGENSEISPKEKPDASLSRKNIIWIAVALATLGFIVVVFGFMQALIFLLVQIAIFGLVRNDAENSVDSQKAATKNSQQVDNQQID